MATAKKKKDDHVVMRNGHPFCENCGQSYVINLPAPIDVAVGAMNGFIKTHKHCKKTWTEPVADLTRNVAERMHFWREQGERGVSSETIYRVLCGTLAPLRQPLDFSHPLDPADFHRCHKLLEIIPEWRGRLEELKVLGDPWPALVDNWDRLTELLLAQKRGQGSSEMYDLMKELGC